jgi:nucleoside-triphosphatase THEP1
MAVKVFILGRPGSGKTTAARHIVKLVQSTGYFAIHFNDYEILRKMFQADCEQKRFRSTKHNGFDVLDFSVLDIALNELEKKVQEYMTSAELITIEFARDDYCEALKHFSRDFLRDVHFLYIDSDLETCLCRIHERVAHPISEDDHPSLSDDAFRIYYKKDNRPYMVSDLAKDHEISSAQVTIIDNMGIRQSFIEKVNKFVEVILEQKTCVLWNAMPLQRSSNSQNSDALQALSLVSVSTSTV